MKASTANSSGHFEKRRRPVKSSKRSQVSKRQDNTNADDSLQWQSMQNDWRRCESMYLSWSGGQGPFVINATSYPDNDVDGITSGALEWEIANLVGNHNYFWTGK